MKLPRKLKKKLKHVILQNKDPRWKPSEVRVKSFEQLPADRTAGYRRMGVPYLNGRLVTSYRLGAN